MCIFMNITAQQKAERFISVLRHCQLLGLKVLQADERGLQMRLPYSEAVSYTHLTLPTIYSV